VAPSVLVVDDDPLIADLVAQVLADEGYAVRRAADGLAALAAVERAQPDLIVSDVMMPRLDGHGLLARLRARGDRTPFVFVSAGQAVQARPDVAFVAKPFDLDRLLRAVADALVPASRASTREPVVDAA